MNEELTTQQNEIDNTVYIDAIRDLKERTVDRDLYQKLKAERDSLVQSLANGTSSSTEEAVMVRSHAEALADFMVPSKSECEYLEKVLELRAAAMREGQPDPFVAEGHYVKPTAQTYQRAEEIAEIYRECLDYAAGDDKVLINEVQRRMR